MRQRRGTAAQWTTANPVLADGELGVESDTGNVKVGDGATAWTGLRYSASPDAVEAVDGLGVRVDDVEGSLAGTATVAALTAESSAREAADTALDGRVDALEAFEPAIATLTDPIVVQFGGSPGALAITSAYHGPFWPTATDLPNFSWEFWSCAIDVSITGYLISEGYGGAHAVLASVLTGIGGSTWNGTTETYFQGRYSPQLGEWVHSRFGWDGKFLHVWINGIHVGMTPFTGPRRAQQGTVYIGGSDHSNLTGRIAMVRAYEGSCPAYAAGSIYAAWVPSRAFMAVKPTDVQGSPDAQFCAHYLGMPTARTIPDLSEGYAGVRHHGQLVNTSGNPNRAPGPFWVTDPTAPFNLAAEPARTRVFAAPTSVPAGAKIWDSVGREDSIPAFASSFVGGVPQTTPGSTEGGSLGVKAWQFHSAANRWGVFDGALLGFHTTGKAGLYVLNDSPDMDVRVDRKNAAGYDTQPPATINRVDQGLILRRVDGSNYLFTWQFRDPAGNNYVRLYRCVAGVDTLIATITLPNYTWTTQRWVLAGTTVTCYIDGVQRGQATGVTDHQEGLGVGLFHMQGAPTSVKAKNFVVY
jgi:hypothetical protein